ncbi:hypothetical protein R3W88_024594 [Solanum pinnatisectum]|uniref:Reverse transcriptase domain-containing protein n=1 Tax=Solanum pinnatisectum TaxID=50273 RepID=A0AAV9M0V3_9SOLN|nr:hypothetical protein R3W88_024594 [Solanum pinnatisectum]
MLSSALFILGVEVLSRALNFLFNDGQYVGCDMPKWSANLNHLAYADDTIIFAGAHEKSLNRIMKILCRYKSQFGQLINKEKSIWYMHQNTSAQLRMLKRKSEYSELIKKVNDKLHTWKGKMLSFGGKATLMNSVLQSIHIHTLSAIVPLKCVINELHKIFPKFFWNNKEIGRSKHWANWQRICLPKAEGDLGFKSLFDVSKAMFAKLWWKFRTDNSLWTNFMWNKYCKKKKYSHFGEMERWLSSVEDDV